MKKLNLKKGHITMTVYSIKYSFKNKYGYVQECHTIVDASSLKFAKNKLKRKHGVKRLTLIEAHVIGYR